MEIGWTYNEFNSVCNNFTNKILWYIYNILVAKSGHNIAVLTPLLLKWPQFHKIWWTRNSICPINVRSIPRNQVIIAMAFSSICIWFMPVLAWTPLRHVVTGETDGLLPIRAMIGNSIIFVYWIKTRHDWPTYMRYRLPIQATPP